MASERGRRITGGLVPAAKSGAELAADDGGAAAAAERVAAALAAERDGGVPDVGRLLAQYQDRAAVAKVSRLNLNSAKPEYLATVPFDSLDEDVIKARWGGGSYRATVLDGARGYLGHISFDIAGAPKHEDAPAAPAAGAAASAETVELRGMVRDLAELVKATLTATAAAAQHAAARPAETSPVDLAVKLMEVMRPAMAPAAVVAPAPASADVLELLTKGIALGKQIAGAGEGAGGFAEVASALGGPILKLADREIALREKQAERPRLVPNDRPAAPAVPAGPAWAAKVRPYVGQLAMAARRNMNVNAFAVAVLSNISDEDYAEIAAAARRDDFTASALAALPELAPYTTYATALLDEIAELVLSPVDGGDGDEGDDAGDDADRLAEANRPRGERSA